MLDTFFQSQKLALYKQLAIPYEERFAPFAMTDTLLEFVEETGIPVLHFWSMENMLILGMKDTRLPYLQAGLQQVKNQHYKVVIRNAGGLAVVADDGVLNFSILLNNRSLGKEKLTISDAYELMLGVMQMIFSPEQPEKIQAFEVTHSYCPGDFDLSIEGKKFAGIAQRRVKNSTAIMAYLSVTGLQATRSQLVKKFYEAGLGAEYQKDTTYPKIKLETMESLDQLLAQPLSINGSIEKIVRVLGKNHQMLNETSALESFLTSDKGKAFYEKKQNSMMQRNQMLENL